MTDNQSVLVLTTSFPVAPKMISGVFIKRLVDQISSKFDVTVVTPASVESFSRKREDDFRLVCFNYGPKCLQRLAHEPGGIPMALSTNPWMYLLLPSFILSELLQSWKYAIQSDLIHANWGFNGFIAGVVGCIARVPVITTLRGSDVNKVHSSKVQRYIVSGCLALSDRVITVSRSIAGDIENEFPQYRNRLEVISNGVDPRLIKIPLPRGNYNKLRLITICNIVPNKGVGVIIKMLENLRDTDIEIKVIGDGAEKERLKQNVYDSGLASKVSFVGTVAPSKIELELKEADVLVLASYSEGRPNVVMEAMAAGVPVIASDIEGIRELIEDNVTGLLFRTGDSKHLTEKVIRLKKNKNLRNNLAKNAREYIIKNDLLWSVSGIKYADLYRKTIQEYR